MKFQITENHQQSLLSCKRNVFCYIFNSPSEETSKEESLDNSMHLDQGSDSSVAVTNISRTGSTENFPR